MGRTHTHIRLSLYFSLSLNLSLFSLYTHALDGLSSLSLPSSFFVNCSLSGRFFHDKNVQIIIKTLWLNRFSLQFCCCSPDCQTRFSYTFIQENQFFFKFVDIFCLIVLFMVIDWWLSLLFYWLFKSFQKVSNSISRSTWVTKFSNYSPFSFRWKLLWSECTRTRTRSSSVR